MPAQRLPVTVVGFSSVLSLLLSTVAALGVFNTVVLNVRERRRDLGMLKSIGMTPRQVVAMVLTSMALVGVVGGVLGIPLGVLAHRYIVPAAADAARVAIPDVGLEVWQVPTLVLLAPGRRGDRAARRAGPGPRRGPAHHRRGAAQRVILVISVAFSADRALYL